MLQPKELRIGNLVVWNPKLANPNSTLPPMPVEVYEIMHDRISYVFPNIENRVEPFEDDVVQLGTHTKYMNELEPIKLKEEILRHAGFSKKGELPGPGYFSKKALLLQPSGDHFKMNMELNAAFDVSIKYLHQLQNFYFSITGEELDIDHFW